MDLKYDVIEIDFQTVCRLCGNVSEQLIPLYEDEGSENELPHKLSQHLSMLKIAESDDLPKKICVQCTNAVLVWHDFVCTCIEADKKLVNMVADMVRAEKTVRQQQELKPNIATHMSDAANSMQTVRKIQYVVDNEAAAGHFDEFEDDSQDFIKIKDTYADSEVGDDERPQCSKAVATTTTTTEVYKVVENGFESPCSSQPAEVVYILVDDQLQVLETVEREPGPVSPPPPSPTFYECHQCGKRLQSRRTFQIHQQIHTGEKPLVCQLCDKLFRHPSTLRRHVQQVHDGSRPHECDICRQHFATRRDVDEHRFTHSGERRYVCDTCGRSFRQKAGLYMHKKTHTAGDRRFKCAQCELRFHNRSALVAHETRHGGEKKWACDQCDKKFRLELYLRQHRLVHDQFKGFVCGECGAEFRQKRYLVGHLRAKHADATERRAGEGCVEEVVALTTAVEEEEGGD